MGSGQRQLWRAAVYLWHGGLFSPVADHRRAPGGGCRHLPDGDVPAFLRGFLAFFTELLAAIPSVVYGLWAVFVLIPLLREYVNPLLIKTLGWSGFFCRT